MKRKILITCALPYANGPIHIGHMMEHIEADIYSRFQKMQGHECLFICADDTHGTPIMIAAFIIDFYTAEQRLSFLPLAIEGFFYLIVIMYYFYERIKYISNTPLYNISSFWVSIGFLLNFSGTFFLYLFSITMSKDPSFKDQYHIIYGGITIIKNILLSVAVIINHLNNSQLAALKSGFEVDLEHIYPFTKQVTNNQQ